MLGCSTHPPRSPSLHQLCSALSGVSAEESEALERLQPSAYARLGESRLRALSRTFYDAVFDDTQPLPSGVLLREAFSSVTREEGAERQACFLIERLGGPPLFTQLRGRSMLLARHAPYNGVTREGGARWLAHMLRSVHSLALDDAELSSALASYFTFTVSYVVEGRLLCNAHNVVGYGDTVQK